MKKRFFGAFMQTSGSLELYKKKRMGNHVTKIVQVFQISAVFRYLSQVCWEKNRGQQLELTVWKKRVSFLGCCKI